MIVFVENDVDLVIGGLFDYEMLVVEIDGDEKDLR